MTDVIFNTIIVFVTGVVFYNYGYRTALNSFKDYLDEIDELLDKLHGLDEDDLK